MCIYLCIYISLPRGPASLYLNKAVASTFKPKPTWKSCLPLASLDICRSASSRLISHAGKNTFTLSLQFRVTSVQPVYILGEGAQSNYINSSATEPKQTPWSCFNFLKTRQLRLQNPLQFCGLNHALTFLIFIYISELK